MVDPHPLNIRFQNLVHLQAYWESGYQEGAEGKLDPEFWPIRMVRILYRNYICSKVYRDAEISRIAFLQLDAYVRALKEGTDTIFTLKPIEQDKPKYTKVQKFYTAWQKTTSPENKSYAAIFKSHLDQLL